jgi:hypothetical protein
MAGRWTRSSVPTSYTERCSYSCLPYMPLNCACSCPPPLPHTRRGSQHVRPNHHAIILRLLQANSIPTHQHTKRNLPTYQCTTPNHLPWQPWARAPQQQPPTQQQHTKCAAGAAHLHSARLCLVPMASGFGQWLEEAMGSHNHSQASCRGLARPCTHTILCLRLSKHTYHSPAIAAIDTPTPSCNPPSPAPICLFQTHPNNLPSTLPTHLPW